MDCKTAQMLIEMGCARRSELERAESQAFDAHLEACPDCRILAVGEQRLDRTLGQAMRAVPLPVGLRDRVLTRLANERNAFYRRLMLRAGVVVLLLLVTGFGVIAWIHSRREQLPPLHPNWLLDMNSSADDLESWYYSSYGIEVQTPVDLLLKWDFQSLTHKSAVAVLGHQIPALQFHKESSRAVVYLLRKGQFDPADLADLEPGKHRDRRIIGNPAKDEFIALVLVQQGAYEDFLKK